MKVIGVMSGSSLDGIDICCVSFDPSDWTWSLESGITVTLPEHIKLGLSEITSATPWILAELESKYSQFMAQSLLTYMESNEVEPDAIGIHGHTILHSPQWKTSWQLINGGMVTSLCQVPVVCDFRNQDMALGGQGTPMAVIADRDLFPGYDYYINLGGIANISCHHLGQWMAFDLCPCNQLLNHYSQLLGMLYDSHGRLASDGRINGQLLSELLTDGYLASPPPKSIDNTWIKETVIPSIDKYDLTPTDTLRTLVEYVITVIHNNLREASCSVLVTGGGAYNSFMMELLRNKCAEKGSKIMIPDSELIDYKEAILIAYCAALRLLKKPNFVSSATGASTDVIGGALYLPN